PSGGVEGRKIADALRELERAERERLAGDRQVGPRRGRDEDEYAAVRPAFMELPGRMEVPRSVAEHGRGARRVADRSAQRLERGIERGVPRGDIREQREVVAVVQQREERVGIGGGAARGRGEGDRR